MNEVRNTVETAMTLSPADAQWVDDVAEQFEAAWKSDREPHIAEFLRECSGARRTNLVRELVHVDLKFRWGKGEQPPVEAYLSEWPELGASDSLFYELLRYECALKQKYGGKPVLHDLCNRFPELDRRRLESEVLAGLPAGDAAVPSKIGRYAVSRRLGGGGFGTVYLGHDEKMDRHVAIKVPSPALLASRQAREEFMREARSVARLRHENIVTVHDFGEEPDGSCYIIYEHISGTNLAERLERGRLPHDETARLIAQVAEALHCAHLLGLIHRDIKPANILLDVRGRPYIADFGLAVQEEELTKQRGRDAGTPQYMAPEQVRGEGHRIDARTDIYSLGVVLYEMLCGHRPFTSRALHELFDQIEHREARPPRTIDDSIPRELERICLKAVSKRMTDRYTTAKDMAEELRLAVTPLAQPIAGFATTPINPVVAGSASAIELSGTSGAPPVPRDARTPLITPGLMADMTPRESPARQLRVIPKGLRSFGPDDAEFFLTLLPGPRDRDGLPESLRFWKSRIESRQADNTFAIGLIYGPSGCGKSSLVRAGLLPLLASRLVPIYVEASREDTEARLLRELHRAFPRLEAGLPLPQMLAHFRRGQFLESDQKIVLVLDQFEQWLHSQGRNLGGSELVAALRQCDGQRVQCLLLVRDDFWLASNRLFQCLEIHMLEDRNVRLVDLFDRDHARHVLELFGAAYGRLPSNPAELSLEQQEFLDRATSDLSQDGMVIPVRLSLFADLMKGRPWTPASLESVGGTEGVGVKFLHETFTARTAVPEHRAVEKPARALLQALLPEHGTDIKGQMRSRSQLAMACGLPEQSKEFAHILELLDHDLHAITPTEAAPKEEGEQRQAGVASPAESSPETQECFYQLTHDYLVPALRDWLTQERRRTWRGRAELRLEELASLWGRSGHSRYLPSPTEFVPMLLGVPRSKRSAQQSAFMRAAGRRHASLVSVLVILLMVVAGAAWWITSHVQDAQSWETDIRSLDDSHLRRHLAEIRPVRGLAKHWLKQIAADPKEEHRIRLHASLLLPVDPTDPHFWEGPLIDSQLKARAIDLIRQKQTNQVWELLWQLLKEQDDPTLRTCLIHRMARGGNSAERLLGEVLGRTDQEDPSIQQARILSLGEIQDFRPNREASERLLQLFRDHPDPGVHSALEWLLLHCNVSQNPQQSSNLPVTAPKNLPTWWTGPNGHTFTVVPTNSVFWMGSLESEEGWKRDDLPRHEETITHAFAIATKETTWDQFKRFLQDYPKIELSKDAIGSDNTTHPANAITWYQAAMYCRWLSDQDKNIPDERKYYPSVEVISALAAKLRPIPVPDVSRGLGYRLPTENEWEFAARARSTTRCYWGQDVSLTGRYAWNAENSGNSLHPVGMLRPNALGLFDMLGSVWEWCDEAHGTDPRRLLRGGGSYSSISSSIRTSWRNDFNPDGQLATVGFRVARTIPQESEGQ